MQFSYLLSAFLATLAVASPIANPEVEADIAARDETYEAAALEARAGGDTVPFEVLGPKASGLKDGNWYVFAQKTPNGKRFDGDNFEPKDELEKLQKTLKFAHIKLITGQYKETKGKGKKGKVEKRDFLDLKFHDLSKETKAMDAPIKLRHTKWSVSKDDKEEWKEQISFVKETTKAKIDALSGFGKSILPMDFPH